MDPPWSLPSRVADNPLVWMVMIDGYIIRPLPNMIFL